MWRNIKAKENSARGEKRTTKTKRYIENSSLQVEIMDMGTPKSLTFTKSQM